MEINKALNRAQSKLIKKAEKNGLYENFGEKEIRTLEERYIDISDYSEEMNTNRRLIELFSNWCWNYSL